MRIDRRIVVAPEHNTLYFAAAFALSILVFAYSTRFGPISILAFYAVWFLPVVLKPSIVLVRLPVAVLLMILPVFTIASTAWSDVPSASLRGGIQLATTVACAIVAARIAGPRGLLLGAIAGFALVLAYSVRYGTYSYDVLDADYTFIGAFGSKNQLGLFASLAVMFGAVAAVSARLPLWLRAAGALSVAPAMVLLLACESVTSWFAMAAALAGGAAVAILRYVRPPDRLPLLLAGAAVMVVVAVVALQADAAVRLFAAFGKDPTMTGRTYLWSEGIVAAREAPVLGLGYLAFWQHGNPPAERLWEAFYIATRSGFHFHNTFIEAAVGLGLTGLAVVAGLYLFLAGAMVRAVATARLSARTMLAVMLGGYFIIRSPVEVDAYYPYTVGTFLFTLSLVTLVESHPVERFVRRIAPRPVASRTDAAFA